MLLGLINVVLALFYLGISIAIPLTRRRMLSDLGVALYIIQAIIAPVLLILAGGILIFQGWRLDPSLQLAFLLLNLLVLFTFAKEWLIFR